MVRYALELVVCTPSNTRLHAVYIARLTHNQGKSTTQVFYKPSPVEHETFSVIVNPDEYKRWSEGDKTIPLVEVVDSFDIFYTEQGSQGKIGRASKQQLENVFGTSTDDVVVAKILEAGADQPVELSGGSAIKNTTQGRGVDLRGSGSSTSGAGHR
ncbi:DUF1960-domain-containing protein [Wallemia mellicola]|uniref:DUF1960-domain-containing protein n=1 Tax=Wallemia mellicola TaxID=1708541 RepID=A0A4T0ME30_9BASI|nr:DUF1960-domain-containing protein [Wallemia mellicola]TIB98904.1 DUF1960-domain-containing protein [Wallemia mellicola]TIC17345.1 DUF1960-domain-containing protein [Wallemia mellicola]TIC57879.1 DUF1960-domain-containing protein [Wallemia mellicola]